MLVVFILLVFDMVVCDGCVKKDDFLMLEVMGGGFIWGLVLLCW